MKSKSELRRECLRALKEKNPMERALEEEQILSKALSVIDSKIKVLSIYVSQAWEVSTHELIKTCLKRNLLVCCPKVLGPGKMAHYKIESFRGLRLSDKGLLEPQKDEALLVKPEEIELVFTPGLAFTLSGARLGYGGGFYDRFFEKCKGFKIGLSFQSQIFPELPMDSHDVELDKIISSLDLLKEK